MENILTFFRVDVPEILRLMINNVIFIFIVGEGWKKKFSGVAGNKRDTNCFVSLYGKTKPSIAAHSPPLRVGLHFAISGFIFP